MLETIPSSILRKKTSPVTKITQGTQNLIDNMFKTMDDYNLIGLAANQININKSILVWNFQGDMGAVINPVILEYSTETSEALEGCGSIPNVSIPVVRPRAILIQGLDRENNQIELCRDNFVSRILQHETDHLNGILMLDRAPISDIPEQLKQWRISLIEIPGQHE
jgi:peptide deformylase